MAQLTVPINVNLPKNWLDLVIERVKQDGDYVLVTRCKDCAKHEYCRTSTVWAIPPKDDWFCADAERRTDERCS